MAKNLVKNGNVKDFLNDTGADIVSGQIVAIGVLLGVAEVDIPIGAVGAVNLNRVWKLPKNPAADISAGDPLRLDVSAGVLDALAGDKDRDQLAMSF